MKKLFVIAVLLVVSQAGSVLPGQAATADPASSAAPPVVHITVQTVNGNGVGVPVSGARVDIGGAPSVLTDASGVALVAPASGSAEAVAHVTDVTVHAAGFGDFVYLSVPLHPGVDPILTPVMTLNNRVDDLSRQTPPPQSTPTTEPASDPQLPLTTGCSGWSSTHTPPNVIRVLDDGTSASDMQVHTVDFQNYVQHVLPNEWIPSWNTEALRAGAVAVKMYGWYRTITTKHGTGAGCYDADGSPAGDQWWDPYYATSPTNQAVWDTWDYYLMDAGGVPFQTSYTAGCPIDQNYACGGQTDTCGQYHLHPADGTVMSQYGSQSCALAGAVWYQILLNHYYFNPQSQLVHGPVATASTAENLPLFIPALDPWTSGLVHLHWSTTASVSYYICYGSYLANMNLCYLLGGGGDTWQGTPTGDFGSVYYRLEACGADGYCSALMAGGVVNRSPSDANDFYTTASFVWYYDAAYVSNYNHSATSAAENIYNGVPGYGGTLKGSCASVPSNATCGPITWALDNFLAPTNTYLSWYATGAQTEQGHTEFAAVRLTPDWCNYGHGINPPPTITSCRSGE